MAITATLGTPTLTHRRGDTWAVSVSVTYAEGSVSLEETASATVNVGHPNARAEFARILQEQVEARKAVLARRIVLTPIAAAVVADVQTALDGE